MLVFGSTILAEEFLDLAELALVSLITEKKHLHCWRLFAIAIRQLI
jgi:hypothetical protein